MASTKYQTLHCESGDHDYDWPVKRGRKPRNCPAHKPEPGTEVKHHEGPEDLSRVIRSTLDRLGKRAINCRCGIVPTMTRQQLTALGAGCTGRVHKPGDLAGSDPGYVCPTLDTIRRAIGYDPNH